jgi:hypothetical protein
MEDDARMHVRRTLVQNIETRDFGYIKTNMEVIVVT